MSLSELKTEIINERIQQVEVTSDGVIIASDDVIFNFDKGAKISSYHPFLEAIEPLLNGASQNINFPCVNLNMDATEKIVDIDIIVKKERLFLLFLDFTEHYEAAHPLVQEKNEASIARNRLDFEKKLLLAKEEFKNSFLANLNHEIRNPLNSMMGFMELLGETRLNYDQHETLKVIQKTGLHIKMLMDDMLDISKIERGVLTKKHVNFHLGSILTNLQHHFDLKFNQGDVFLEIANTEHMLKTYKGDPIRLNQILFNLLENAFRSTKKGKVTLTITSEELNEKNCMLTFEVTDTGKGIPTSELDHIFEAYYQLKLNEDKPLGEGLGLKVVKDLVELLEGTVTVASDGIKGATFTCKLPFEKRTPKREKKTIQKGTGIFQSKRILVVEDESTNQMLFMKMFLNNEKGYIIEIANNATQTFDLLEKKNYHLIITKSELPDMDGKDLLATLSAHELEEVVNTPILIASGSTLLEEQQDFLDAGAAAFIAKPYSKKELFNCIEKLIR